MQLMEQGRERKLIEGAGKIGTGGRGRLGGRARGRLLGGAAQLARHHREQRLERDGLAQQAGRAQRLGAAPILGRRRGARDQHHRDLAGGRRHRAQRLQHGEAVQLGKHQVEQHEIRGSAAEKSDGVLAVEGGRHAIAFAAQRLGQDLAEIPVVVDAEDGRAHHRPSGKPIVQPKGST